MSSSKMCFNCFEKVGVEDTQCENCGVELYSETVAKETQQDSYNLGLFVEPDYDAEIKKLDDVKKAEDVKYSTKSAEDDLKFVAVLISIIGLLQIYTGGLIDSINRTSVFLEIEPTLDGKYLVYSGFLYFAGILLFFINYKFARITYLIGNSIHIFILYKAHSALFLAYDFLTFFGRQNLPPELQEFLDNVGQFRLFIVLFGIFYVVQSIFLFRFEFSKYVYRRDRYR